MSVNTKDKEFLLPRQLYPPTESSVQANATPPQPSSNNNQGIGDTNSSISSMGSPPARPSKGWFHWIQPATKLFSGFLQSKYTHYIEAFFAEKNLTQEGLRTFIGTVNRSIPPETTLKEQIIFLEGLVQALIKDRRLDPNINNKQQVEEQLRNAFFGKIFNGQITRLIASFSPDGEPDDVIVPFLAAKEELTKLLYGKREISPGFILEKVLFVHAFCSANEDNYYPLILPFEQRYNEYHALKWRLEVGKNVPDAEIEKSRLLLTAYGKRWSQWAYVFQVVASDKIQLASDFYQGEPITIEQGRNPRTMPLASSPVISDEEVLAWIPSIQPPLLSIELPPPACERMQLSYIDALMKDKELPKDRKQWYIDLPFGQRYRLYQMLGDKKPGRFVEQLGLYHQEYHAIGYPQWKNYSPLQLTQLFLDLYVRKMEAGYPDQEVIRAVKFFITPVELDLEEESILFYINSIPERFFNNSKFLQFIYEQAVAEGVKIEGWDTRWAEFHYKDSIPSLAQAIMRWYDQQITDYYNANS